MNITFYQYSKKENSTRIVDVSGTALSSCQLKAPTSMLYPTLIIQGIPSGWSTIWNYCYIPDFNRYYFVKDWRWLNGVWECDCSVDVLASWKTQIGLLNKYILRTNTTDSTVYNANITDTIYPVTNQYEKNIITVQNSPFVSPIIGGTYIIGVISSGNPAYPQYSVGAINYYILTPLNMEYLKQELLTESNLQTMGIIDALGNLLVQDMSKEVLKTMYNPYQYIVSCMWFPFDNSFIPDKTYRQKIKIGWWEYNVNCFALSAQTVILNENIGLLPWHPQAQYRGWYLNYEPYTKTSLIGRFGTIAVDTSYLRTGVDSLKLEYTIDIIQGLCLVKLISYYTDDHNVIQETPFTTRTFQIGVPIQLAQVGVDYLASSLATVNQTTGVITGAATGIASAVTGNYIGAAYGGISAISSYTNGIYNKLSASMPIVETSGTNGSFISPLQDTKLLQLYYFIALEDIAQKGRPVCSYKVINTLSGFILCNDGDIEGDVDIPCLNDERALISSYLTTGFFWE